MKYPLSHSQISLFKFSPELWFEQYINGIKRPETIEMLFGKQFALSCEKRKPLAPVTLLSKSEYKFEVMFSKIPLIGYADTFDHRTCRTLGDHKTGKKAWDQQRADDSEQLTMYALLNYITNAVKPEEMELFIEWVPTEDRGDFTIGFVEPVKVFRFDTKRTMKDILKFAASLLLTHKQMQQYAKAQRALV